MNKLTVVEQKELLNHIDGLPPIIWLEKCKTPDQICHWENIKYIFQNINIHLESFFSGNEIDVDTKNYKLSDSEFEERVYKLLSRKFLDLYSVIYYGFKEIRLKAEELNIDIPEKPGEYLIQCLKEEAVLKFSQCQTYHEHRPKTLTSLHRNINKYPMLVVKDNLSRSEKNLIKQLQKAGERIRERRSEITPLQLFALSVATLSRDEEVRVSLRAFDNTCARLAQLLNSKLHPRHKPKNSTWNRGYYSS